MSFTLQVFNHRTPKHFSVIYNLKLKLSRLSSLESESIVFGLKKQEKKNSNKSKVIQQDYQEVLSFKTQPCFVSCQDFASIDLALISVVHILFILAIFKSRQESVLYKFCPLNNFIFYGIFKLLFAFKFASVDLFNP